jgi:hypothetical protein
MRNKLDRSGMPQTASRPVGARWPHLLRRLIFPIACCVASNMVVFGAFCLAPLGRALPPPFAHVYRYGGDRFANWDGQWYLEIAERGYSYDPNAQSSVAFFPVYPLIGRAVGIATGLGAEVALLVTSNAMFMMTLVVVREMVRTYSLHVDAEAEVLTVLVLATFPTTFIFRTDYSESTFLFITSLALFGMRRDWPLPALAGLVGLSTAARPVGIALVPGLIAHALGHSRSGSRSRRLVELTALGAASCWGLFAYMIFQALAFADPFAFARTQVHWRTHVPGSAWSKAVSLATLEPIWSVLCSWYPGYAGKFDLLSQRFADPFVFVLAVALTAIGAYRRWISRPEAIAGFGLLLIPYLTKAYENLMGSMGRHACVCLPVYLVLGRLLAPAPRPVAVSLLAVFAWLLFTYTAEFARWQ